MFVLNDCLHGIEKTTQKLVGGILRKLVSFFVVRVNTEKCRSSHRSCSIKKVLFKNFAKFTGKHLWEVSF